MTILSNDLDKAATFLKEGKLVAFPTETVYGLGGNALSDNAVAGIYAAKGRPSFNPLIVHVASLDQAHSYADFNSNAEKLAERFWPGAMTLVLPRKKDCPLSLLLSAGLDTVAIRMPSHPLAIELLKRCGLPLAAPSANRSGRVSPTMHQHVMEELNDRIAMVVEGGQCEVGIESTVVDVTGKQPVILRPGSLTKDKLGEIFPSISYAASDSPITAPGMLSSHYAPAQGVRLNAQTARAGEGLLAFGNDVPQGAAVAVQNLSVSGNLEEAAANLFRMLRMLDAASISGIAVMPIPNEGLGIAINDRLMRAAAPKEDNQRNA